MTETFVAKPDSLKDGDRMIVAVGDKEIGVFRHRGKFYAYSNNCLHSGGPACEGLIIAKVFEQILPDKTSAGLFFSDDDTHFVCPWHGYEYNIETGACAGDPRQKLRSYPIVVKDAGIFVVT